MPAGLTDITRKYLTRNTIFTSITAGWQLILPTDPRRYYVKFLPLTPLGLTSSLMPAPVPDGFTPTTQEADLGPFLYRDMPAAVTGEWYIFYNVGEQWSIVEQLFLGD